MKIPLLGAHIDSDIPEQNPRQLVNWFLEEDSLGGSFPFIAKPTPGLSVFGTISATVIRALFTHKEIVYAVADNKFYSIDSAGVETERGTLLTSTGRVSIAAIDGEIMLVDGSKGYTYVIATTTFAQITDVDFPSSVDFVTAQDGYFIIVKPSSGRFHISALNDGQTWAALDFATAEGSPDNLVACISDRREVWLLGERTTEIWANTGGTFPFTRISGVFIQHGIAAKHTLAQGDNTLFWLAKNNSGQSTVVRTDGLNATIISNRGITDEIDEMTTVDDAFAYVYQQSGHEFYVLTFPTENKTFCYDASTAQWHRRTSYGTVSQTYDRHRSNCMAFAYGKILVGGYNDGNIYSFSQTTYTDNGTHILRKLVTGPLFNDNKWLTAHNLEINFKKGVGLVSGQGSDPQAMLRISKDGGRTWSNSLWRSPGSIGSYTANALWNRLGSTKNAFVFELTATDPVEWVILGATADIEKEMLDKYDEGSSVTIRQD